jgi:hypothetical protein
MRCIANEFPMNGMRREIISKNDLDQSGGALSEIPGINKKII